jgi:peroxin-7
MAIQSLTGKGDASSLFHPCSVRPCTLSCLIPSSSYLAFHFYFRWSPRYRLTTVFFLPLPPPPTSLSSSRRQEHSAEVSSVHWNQVAKTSFLSASWDGSIKLWDPHHPTSLSTYCGHTGCVYAGIHSPRHSHRFLSCGTDGSLRIWDTKLPPSHATSLALGRVEGGAVQVVRAHEGEVLSADWDKYQDFLVYTGGVDRSIKMWDLRRPSLPLGFLHGHGYAVRRLKTSPHQEGVLGSVSYDMSCRVWGPTRVRGRAGELWRCEEHTEFVQGLDFHLFWPGRIATCGWDRRVCVWTLPFA